MNRLQVLEEYVHKKLLRKSETEDLVQYNYTEYCNNNALWDDITMTNRGNIYEKSTGNLVAKAMPKFMNLYQLPKEQQDLLLQHQDINVTEKMDGCLGILYLYKGEIRCNSRGGFDNYVTDKIKQLLPKYSMLYKMLEHNTLLVEVISPQTKIICNYDTEDLYLITVYSNNPQIGELSYEQIKIMAQIMRMPVVKEYHMTWDELLTFQKVADWQQEGFVVRIGNTRVKIKSEDYLKIAKLRANLCKHTVWKLMKNDFEQHTDTLKPYLENVPDELSVTAQKYHKELLDEMNHHHANALVLYDELKNVNTSELHNYFLKNPSQYQACVYNLRNAKNIDKLLIKMIEPQKGFENTENMLCRE